MNFLLHFFCHSRLLERAANMGHGYSLTALPIIEGVWTGSHRMNKVGRGETDGSRFIQATARSNPKAQSSSMTVIKKDIHGVQESEINLFRRVVPKFHGGTSELEGLPLKVTSSLDSRKRVNKCFHRHGVELDCTMVLNDTLPFFIYKLGQKPIGFVKRSCTSFGGPSRIFTGRNGVISRLFGKRIYSTNSQVQAGESYSGTESPIMGSAALHLSKAKKDKNGKYINIFPIVYDEQNLWTAWNVIKSKPGNLTQGGTPGTLDGLRKEWFADTSRKLSLGEYEYSPARRVSIPKGSGKKGSRPLTVANPRDKIVQQAFLQVMSLLWEGLSSWTEVNEVTWTEHKQEFVKNYPMSLGRKKSKNSLFVRRWVIPPVFLNSSHGFRPGRSVHSALKEVKKYWLSTKWFIKLDIRKAFDRTDHHILANMIESVVSDGRLVDEIYKMLKVRIVNFNRDVGGLGVPQGSVLSPFLFNVFMHRLDNFMEGFCSKAVVKGKKKENPLYASERYKVRSQLDKEGASLSARLRAFRALRKKLKRAGHVLHLRVEHPRSVHYIRYADDFLIGVCGDKEFAKDVKKKVLNFVKSELNFDVSLSSLSHAKSDKTEFLGFKLSKGVLGPRVKGRTLERFHRLQTRLKDRRAAEYGSYLRMLKEAEKRFWIRTTEAHLRKANQTMMSAWQVSKGLGDLSRRKVLESLRSSIHEELSRAQPEPLLAVSKKQETRGPENPRLSEARTTQDSVWSHTVRRWVSLAKAVARIVPSEEAELMEALDESEIKELLESRSKYFSLLDNLSSRWTKKKMVSYVYSKHADKMQGQRAGGNQNALISRELTRAITPQSVFIEMPYELVKQKLREKGYIKNDFPCSKPILCNQHDLDIIQHYNYLARGLLNFYCCADNRWQLLKLINWHLRYSLIHTLAHKHNKTVSQTIKLYSLAPSIWTYEGAKPRVIVAYIGTEELFTRKKEFLTGSQMSHESIMGMFEKTIVKVSTNRLLFDRCSVKDCENKDIEIHHVRKLSRRFRGGIVTVASSKARTGVSGKEMGKSLISALSRKQIPLCSSCHVKIHSGLIQASDLDPKYVHAKTTFLPPPSVGGAIHLG
jgi:RNA-directed DNA polymerase